MSGDALKTLFHPFVTGAIDAPAEGTRILFAGAEPGFILPENFAGSLFAVQPLKCAHDRLAQEGHAVTPVIAEGDYDQALLLLNKHKGENEARLAAILRRLEPGSLITIAGTKEDGILTLRKKLYQLDIPVESMPKYHGVALWFARPDDATALPLADSLDKGTVTLASGFQAAAGMFSHDRIDEGSELLAKRLPADFDGNAADLGAGWGYLSVMLAEVAPRLNRVDLFEAHHQALEAARSNMEHLAPTTHARFFWQDVVHEVPKERYDVVITNPPFHDGHAAEPGLGQGFIRTAWTILRQGGRMLLVANRGLPYEPVIASLFRESGEVCRNARFKVLWAKK